MNILLFPGSFSPFTDGHYGIISRYINTAKKQNIPIDRIVILMSSKDREGINSKSVYKFVSRLFSNDKRFEVRFSSEKGPVSDVYKYVNVENGKGNKNNYIFLRSDKDNDSVASDFYKNFGKGGKYALDNVTVTEMNVDNSPILYKTRKDDFNNKPISASVVRNDLRNKDFNSFLTSYQMILNNEMTIDKNVLKQCFDAWSKTVQNESKETEKKLSK